MCKAVWPTMFAMLLGSLLATAGVAHRGQSGGGEARPRGESGSRYREGGSSREYSYAGGTRGESYSDTFHSSSHESYPSYSYPQPAGGASGHEHERTASGGAHPGYPCEPPAPQNNQSGAPPQHDHHGGDNRGGDRHPNPRNDGRDKAYSALDNALDFGFRLRRGLALLCDCCQTEPAPVVCPYYVEVPVAIIAPEVCPPEIIKPGDFPLIGCEIIAGDGTYLGRIDRDQKNPDSIADRAGAYGDPFSRLSIFNSNDLYGSATSIYSPWYPHAISPPALFYEKKFQCYLSNNADVRPRLYPQTLWQALGLTR